MWRGALAIASICATLASGAAPCAAYSYSEVQRGKYLIDAGDCVACHTRDKGVPFAGGRPIATPFGIIYSANITPDPETGIGQWSETDFYNAMHFGRRPTGQHLYPAFPYPYFTRMPRDDVRAIRAYLQTLKPVRSKPPENDLDWPLGWRAFMRGWNWLYFEPGVFRPDLKRSAAWNRGAYLVQGPGHCGACHTPKNSFGADDDDRALAGGRFQNWRAPSLIGDDPSGLAAWSVDEIAQYLKTGRNRHSGATGPMAEVVENSTSKLDPADLRAIALYLKSLRSGRKRQAVRPDGDQVMRGASIYAASCSACHQSSGEGVPHLFPPLKGSAVAMQRDPTTVIRLILQGARTVSTAERPTPSTMPAYDWKLTDAEIAAVATYVRNAWGNRAPVVDADDVADLRETLKSHATYR
ncbi:MAG: cytochrome c [Rhodospirillaceae bacterium]|nr:cytochrome c [Rhodospirillaceae bacterium]